MPVSNNLIARLPAELRLQIIEDVYSTTSITSFYSLRGVSRCFRDLCDEILRRYEYTTKVITSIEVGALDEDDVVFLGGLKAQAVQVVEYGMCITWRNAPVRLHRAMGEVEGVELAALAVDGVEYHVGDEGGRKFSREVNEREEGDGEGVKEIRKLNLSKTPFWNAPLTDRRLSKIMVDASALLLRPLSHTHQPCFVVTNSEKPGAPVRVCDFWSSLAGYLNDDGRRTWVGKEQSVLFLPDVKEGEDESRVVNLGKARFRGLEWVDRNIFALKGCDEIEEVGGEIKLVGGDDTGLW